MMRTNDTMICGQKKGLPTRLTLVAVSRAVCRCQPSFTLLRRAKPNPPIDKRLDPTSPHRSPLTRTHNILQKTIKLRNTAGTRLFHSAPPTTPRFNKV